MTNPRDSRSDRPGRDSGPEEGEPTQALDQHLTQGGTGGEFEPGHTLGPYRLLEILGKGGMGAVWLAEQTEPVVRKVALKLIQTRLHSSAAVARFEIERQVLAQMAHPAIAHVYDAGTTEQGYPWLAMEYVPGEPITRYCNRHRLDTRQRLELIMRVCQGVQHAHQKGVLHRDLKPANILVTEVDGKPAPKIIDFGIAVTEQSVSDEDSGPVAGTPEYMSPEQADPDGGTVDTRTDIYALGVILFELLTGQRALDRDLTDTPMTQVHELLRERDPFTPSARLNDPATDSAGIAASQRTSPRHLLRELRHDLDWIVLRATDPERENRYASAQALAADIQRFVEHHPVEAAPGGRAYRAVKFVRRNRGAVAGASVALLALTVGLVLSVTAMIQTDRARAEAERHRAELSEVVDFQQRMIADLVPEAMGIEILDVLIDRLVSAGIERSEAEDMLALAGGTEVARRVLIGQMLDPAARALDETIDAGDADPALRATLARAYEMAGSYNQAREQLETAVERRMGSLGPEHPATMELRHELADVLHSTGDSDAAESLLREVIEGLKGRHGPHAVATLEAEFTLGYVELRTGRPEPAAQRLDRVVSDLERVDPDHPKLPQMRIWLSNALAESGNVERALHEGRQAAEHILDLPPEQMEIAHIDVLRLYGRRLIDHGEVSIGTDLLRQTLELARSRLGDRHPETANVMNGLALALEGIDRHDEALPLMYEAREIYRMVFGERHRSWLVAQNNLALIHSSNDDFEIAVSLARSSVETAREMLDPSHHELVMMEYNYGARLLRAGMIDEAVEQLERALDLSREVHGERHFMGSIIATRLVLALYRQEQTDRAIELAETAMPQLEEDFGKDHRFYVRVAVEWVELLADRYPELAREKFEKLEWMLTADTEELHESGIHRWVDQVRTLHGRFGPP